MPTRSARRWSPRSAIRRRSSASSPSPTASDPKWATVPTRSPTRLQATPTRAVRPPTPTPAPTRLAVTPTPGPGFGSPRILAPPDDAKYKGYNDKVILEWSEVGTLGPNDYYVVRVPYDRYGGVAEFWTKELWHELPGHLSESKVGFTDRRYAWTVQVMQCTENCDEVYNPNIPKQGVALGPMSREGTFVWEPDFGR